MKKLNWGIIGTGWIAHEMGAALQEENGEIYAVCGTSKEKAEKFAQEFSVEKAYGNTEDLFSDEVVDIIYIATPHNTHYELMKKAIAAGKHVLCEKSITVNSSQLEECVEIGRAHV